ncbi:hypothetical protein PFICI_14510 [Pestalotiopsis fici W106-1]|uniref:Uncharacterized protein n=1 Tax=Pestalotiopsis fici (strain W106-1 / CGMCC3.15140) TaxID=1229662 RepID=W3WIF6_PESFW|nr:uncharacterized protein PFICI_14510 [Pestalotiopsis fici W106-1]ETS73564.1 hypothetical protein PFICI_14510 [Pestalotiopsis fici W106-1]
MAPPKIQVKRKRINDKEVNSNKDKAPAKRQKQQQSKNIIDDNASVIISSHQKTSPVIDTPTAEQEPKVESDDGHGLSAEQSVNISPLTGKNLETLSRMAGTNNQAPIVRDPEMQEVRHMIDNHEERFMSFSRDNEAWKERAATEAKDTRDHVQKQINDFSLRMDNQIEGIKDFFLRTFRSELSTHPLSQDGQQTSSSTAHARPQPLSEDTQHCSNMLSSPRPPLNLHDITRGGETSANLPTHPPAHSAPSHVMGGHGQYQENNGSFIPSQQHFGQTLAPMHMPTPSVVPETSSNMTQGPWAVPRVSDLFALKPSHTAGHGSLYPQMAAPPPIFPSSFHLNTRGQACEPQIPRYYTRQAERNAALGRLPFAGQKQNARTTSMVHGYYDDYEDCDDYDDEDYCDDQTYKDPNSSGILGEVDGADLQKAVDELGLASEAYTTSPKLTKESYQTLLRTFDFANIGLLEAFSKMDDRRQVREYVIFCDISHPSMWIDYVIQVSETAYSMMEHAPQVNYRRLPPLEDRDLSRLRIIRLRYDADLLSPKQSIIFQKWREEHQPPTYVLEIGSLVLRHRYTKKMKDKLHDTDLSLVMDVVHPDRPVWLILRPGWKESCRKTSKTVRDATRAFDGSMDDAKIACVCKDIRSLQLTWKPSSSQSAQQYVGAQLMTRKTQLKVPVRLTPRSVDVAEMQMAIQAARGDEN